ncbi:hypothetical protein FJT64_001880 [Amphibalanus amphitrite]|uniref:Uncharacterized protein n=1 Tax=Amphibalanus amphitrite TaxID=1232801 RepID=A0A6A4X8P0_AMPAM|nr:hypothetical protein FJT64_001880 [Amphibalanus amphitrite]
MGRNKRKNNSPLQRDESKSRRTADENVDDVDADGCSQGGQEDQIAELKEFIRNENARSNKSLAQEIRRCNEERLTAIETSLSFAMAANETMAKRLVEVEQRAQRAEENLAHCARRLCLVEEQLDDVQQRELQDWLIFSGPAIPRRSQSGRNEDSSRLLYAIIHQHMGYEMDVAQLREVYRDERQIRVRFSAVGAGSDRYHMVRNKTKLRGTGLYIRERLTPFRQKLFNELMRFKMARQISTVFTRDGTVFAVVGRRDQPRPVRTEAAMERLIRQLMDIELDDRQQMADQDSRRARAIEPEEASRSGTRPARQEGPALATGGDTERSAERHTEQHRPVPAGDRVGSEREEPRQSVGDGVMAVEEAAAELPPADSPPPAGSGSGFGSLSVSGSGGAWTGRRAPSVGEPRRAPSDGEPRRAPPGGELRAPPGGRSGGCDGRPSAAAERAPVVGEDGRLQALAPSKVRQRFRGDLRQFVTVHSKSD